MLEYVITVVGQIVSMFLMVAVGFIMFKFGMLTEKGIKEMSTLLLRVVTPMILISSFQREFDKGLMISWLVMFLASAFIYLFSIMLAEVIYRKKGKNFAENRISLVLPNNGFFAFPLLQALVGEFGIFYGSANVILFNILLWTYGSYQMQPKGSLKLKNILSNPGLIAVVFGLILFCSPVKLPYPVYNAVSAIGSMNTPLAMILLGGMLAQTDLKKELSKISFYKLSFFKLILVPVAMMLVFAFIPIENDLRLVAIVCSATPTATAVGMIAQIYDRDYRYATTATVVTTIISGITLPVMLVLAKAIIGF